ncbi:hypothetical protein PVK06_030648 [Gossypium arboreum]|uniref:Uncharacterized protein n=1 Tax=Gossypium arboreum TaxID=29729 RepID=A0ABR0NNX2_GOSAR|nr:hypothetical protein PVK06_030648 [Gossypium arboreum]
MAEEHKATMMKMAEEYKVAIASLEQGHKEALEGYKKETLQNFYNVLLELKANLLLHAQVVGGPLDALKVNIDAFCDIASDQLGFDVHFPFGAMLEKILSKGKRRRRSN